MDLIQMVNVNGHIEVTFNNKFLFSADTEQEAEHELKSQMNVRECVA